MIVLATLANDIYYPYILLGFGSSIVKGISFV